MGPRFKNTRATSHATDNKSAADMDFPARPLLRAPAPSLYPGGIFPWLCCCIFGEGGIEEGCASWAAGKVPCTYLQP